jgi:cellulose synthase (UDP-forming)
MATFGEYMSSLGLTYVILGFALVFAPFARRDSFAERAIVLGITVLLGWRYMAWRFTDTVQPLELSFESMLSWGFAGLEALTLVSSTIAAVWLSGTSDRRNEAALNHGWWGAKPPLVDIYIATYNEDRDVLERSIAGAKHTSYPNIAIFVLDDGRRQWLADFCAAEGIGYRTRPDNAHAKAGNINYTFNQRMNDPDPPRFIAVLDADFVPHRDFVDHALSLFHNLGVGIVQTPQYFFNPDPVQHNLGIADAYPDEQRFFFDHVEPARDAWGLAMCCGTSSIIRASALAGTGGFPTGSVTEDYLLTVRFSEAGWKTVYLNEALTEGLAPEGLQEYIVQRGRWCLGFIQIVRDIYNPLDFRNRLSLRMRLGLTDSFLYWLCTYPFRLAALIIPLLYWYSGIVVVDAPVAGILAYFVPYYVATLVSLNWISGSLIMPLLVDVSQLIAAWPITRATWTGLIWKGPHKFQVTAKGGDRSKIIVQWDLIKPFAILFALTVTGLFLSRVTDYSSHYKAGDGVTVIVFWTLYNLLLLAITMLLCVEQPRAPHSMRLNSEPVSVEMGGRSEAGWAHEISGGRALVRGPSGLPDSGRVRLNVDGVGAVEADIAERRSDGYVLRLLPEPGQRSALLAKLHTATGAPGIVYGSFLGVAEGLLRRFLSLLHPHSEEHPSGE